jgi:hypothetical protein
MEADTLIWIALEAYGILSVLAVVLIALALGAAPPAGEA